MNNHQEHDAFSIMAAAYLLSRVGVQTAAWKDICKQSAAAGIGNPREAEAHILSQLGVTRRGVVEIYEALLAATQHNVPRALSMFLNAFDVAEAAEMLLDSDSDG